MQKATYTGSFLSLDVFLHVHSAVPQGPWRLTYTGRCRVWLLHVATLISEKGLDFTHLLEIWVGIGHVSCLYGLKMFESQPNSQFYFGFWQYRTWFILIFNFTSQYLGKVGRNLHRPIKALAQASGPVRSSESHQICRSKKLVPGCSWDVPCIFLQEKHGKTRKTSLCWSICLVKSMILHGVLVACTFRPPGAKGLLRPMAQRWDWSGGEEWRSHAMRRKMGPIPLG